VGRLRLLPWLLAVTTGCSGGSSGDPPDAASVPPERFIFPRLGHTGFDGVNTFRIPIGTTLPEPVLWEVEDPAIFSLASVPPPSDEATFDTWAMLTTAAPGTSQLFATGDVRLVATIVVSAYDAADVAIGATRYQEVDGSGDPDRVPCASCHQQAGGADHSPVEVAVYPDADLLAAITTGAYPDGRVLMGVDHTWNISAAEEVGIVAYLRSLAPRGF
jgi:hypothetical protein